MVVLWGGAVSYERGTPVLCDSAALLRPASGEDARVTPDIGSYGGRFLVQGLLEIKDTQRPRVLQ